MSIVSNVIVTMVGLSTLLVGTPSLFAGTDGPGIMRQRQPALDAGYESTAGGGEAGAESDDADGDARNDHDWIAGRATLPRCSQCAGPFHGGLAPPRFVPVPCRTTDVIRGPPARG